MARKVILRSAFTSGEGIAFGTTPEGWLEEGEGGGGGAGEGGQGLELISFRCEDCERIQFYRGCYCGDRFLCKFCRTKRLKRLQNIYEKVLEKFKYPSMLTLTLKSMGEGYIFDLMRLQDCFKRLRRRKVWKKKVKQYFGSYEVAENQVHLHLIIDCMWWAQEEISELWHKITGDSFIVDIRRVRSPKKAVKEIFKYIVKFWEFDDQTLKNLKQELKGFRLIVASKGLSASSLDTTEISEQNKCKNSSVRCEKCGKKMKFSGVFGSIEEADMYFGSVYRFFMDGVEIQRKVYV